MIMYNAVLAAGAYFQVPPSRAVDLGTGDFTLTAMIASTVSGPVISQLGPDGAGFLLTVLPNSTVSFITTDGATSYDLLSPQTPLLNGGCHTLTAIRRGTLLRILLDGTQLAAGPSPQPVDVGNNLPLLIGATQASVGNPRRQGTVMNVGVWSAALDQDAIVAGAFARVQAADPDLRGYWTFDNTTADLSAYGNEASAVGPAQFLPCVDCIWTSGANSYGFCQMTNAPSAGQAADPELAAIEITQSREIEVLPGTPALYMSIMSQADEPAFPDGAIVVLADPGQRLYDANTNTATTFVVTQGGQLWGAAIVNPQPGRWRMEVSAPATTGFAAQFQTCPAEEIVASVTDALLPLYGPDTGAAAAPGGWLSVLVQVAVAALVGVIVAGLVIVTGGAALPAVVAGFAAFTATGVAQASLALPEVSTSSLGQAGTQVGGMGGFLVAVDTLLLVDANAGDDGTIREYLGRKASLYPYVTASTFNRRQQALIGDQDTRANVRSALLSFSTGYVSISGHGRSFYATGWYVSGTSGDLQQVLTEGKYSPAEVQSKIIHIFACHCGHRPDSGLGRDVVANGAVAFFGYSGPYKLSAEEYQLFCDGDIAIDKALIDGKTCEEAHQAAIATYNENIVVLRQKGAFMAAVWMTSDRDGLVSPVTDPAYGRKDARLNTGAHPQSPAPT
jgi:Concanavalin A-like lectin/glucanases superfamily